ncbi:MULTISPECIES: Yip1 family protein [unclassified Paracoccus (in: a-proteobacteria)]|uniref:Yip1 family protein n=1 Tax=unclassified Paracoccus (in: a-proteobacteria) TaxID=2688777 RepID=UPI00036FF3D7|nr:MULTISPECIES: Yip1 family protein [unclassified Paracoccus (in: a-proteobacteria)]MCV2448632.1 YIP1 family protein [Paracoccus sp. DMF]
MTSGDLGDLVVLTLRRPEAALQVLRRLALPMSARWTLLLLAVTLSTLLACLSLMLFPVEFDNALSRLLSHPLTLAGVQFGAMVVSALMMAQVGRWFGGQGDFADALLVVAWVELLLVGLQAVQLVMTLLFPATAALLSILAFGLFLYLAVTMTKALHGFTSTAKVVVGLVGSLFVLGFVLSLFAAAFGIVPEVTP